jgi:arginase
MKKTITTIGIEIGIGAGNPGTKKGPNVIKNSSFLPPCAYWKETITAPEASDDSGKLFGIVKANEQLAQSVFDAIKSNQFFLIIGGDHSCAIGTWSGVSAALNADFGLIWIDAHCDAHTPETTHTGNVHGMPVAALLGYGDKNLISITHTKQKLKPENLVMIGIRDYETEEHQLLNSLGVKIFYNTDVAQRGMESIMKEAIQYVKRNTTYYGFSFDLDGIDPQDIPAVGTPVPNGIRADDCLSALRQLSNDKALIGYEIVEFNPDLDQNQITEKYISAVIQTIEPGV